MRTAGSYAPEKTNERPGTRATVRYARTSAWKIRIVLDLIRGKTVAEAAEILQYTERAAADLIGKCLASAVANAVNNDGLTADELYVAACYADEGPTLKRWRPRARGRATRIRKRTSHLTIIVGQTPEELLERIRARESARSQSRSGRAARSAAEARRRRVERSRGGAPADTTDEAAPAEEGTAEDVATEQATADDVAEDVGTEVEDLDEGTTEDAEPASDADADAGDDAAGAAAESEEPGDESDRESES